MEALRSSEVEWIINYTLELLLRFQISKTFAFEKQRKAKNLNKPTILPKMSKTPNTDSVTISRNDGPCLG